MSFRNHSDTGGARKTGQPGQPVKCGRNVLVLILVLMRNNEAVERPAIKLRAEQRQVLSALGSLRADFK